MSAAEDESKVVTLDALSGDIASKLSKNKSVDATFFQAADLEELELSGVISTGSEWLDLALGRGGAPMGRFVLLTGAEGSGKTSISLNLCRETQQVGGIAFYIDGEDKLDIGYAYDLGVTPERFNVIKAETLEAGFDSVLGIAEYLEENEIDVPVTVIIDSLDALTPAAELEGKNAIGTQARIASQKLRKLTRSVNRTNMLVVMVSQVRNKLNVMYGDTETTSCGNAPRFYSTVIMKLSPFSAIKEGGVKIGNKVRVTVQKNQIAPPFVPCELIIRYGKGVDYVHSLHEALKAKGLVEEKNAGWVTYTDPSGEQFKWQGFAGLEQILETNPEKRDMMISAIREGYGW